MLYLLFLNKNVEYSPVYLSLITVPFGDSPELLNGEIVKYISTF
jgi:hypothetical protein